ALVAENMRKPGCCTNFPPTIMTLTDLAKSCGFFLDRVGSVILFFSRVAKLTGDTVAPTSRDRRPGHGGSAAASAAPRAAPPTPLAALASPPHSPDATPSLPPAGAASPSPRS